jgi:hypothetical protein
LHFDLLVNGTKLSQDTRVSQPKIVKQSREYSPVSSSGLIWRIVWRGDLPSIDLPEASDLGWVGVEGLDDAIVRTSFTRICSPGS